MIRTAILTWPIFSIFTLHETRTFWLPFPGRMSPTFGYASLR